MRTAVSHTRLDTFENCPLTFKATYRDKVKTAKTAPMLVGGFFAEWSKAYIDHLVKTRQTADYHAGNTILEESWAARGQHKEFKFMPEPLRFEVREIVDDFLGSHVFDPATVMGTELDVALTENWKPTGWFDKDVFFRAKLDLATLPPSDNGKTVGITDYKTGRAALSEEDTKRSSQLRRYVVAMSAMIPDAARFLVDLDFVRLGIVRGPYELEPEVAEEEKQSILSISDRIEKAIATDKWEATPGAGCSWCPIFDKKDAKGKYLCSEREAAEPFRALQTEDDAILAMKRLIIVEKERKDLQKLLQPWSAKAGPVVVGGMQYGPQTKENKSYDPKWLQEFAGYYHLDMWTLLKGDNEAIKKKVGKLDTDMREKAWKSLDEHVSIKAHSEWRLKKFKEERE